MEADLFYVFQTIVVSLAMRKESKVFGLKERESTVNVGRPNGMEETPHSRFRVYGFTSTIQNVTAIDGWPWTIRDS